MPRSAASFFGSRLRVSRIVNALSVVLIIAGFKLLVT